MNSSLNSNMLQVHDIQKHIALCGILFFEVGCPFIIIPQGLYLESSH